MTTRRTLLAAAALLPVLATRAARADEAQATAFVDALLKELLAIVNGPGTIESKRGALVRIVETKVDVDAVARFCLGRFWPGGLARGAGPCGTDRTTAGGGITGSAPSAGCGGTGARTTSESGPNAGNGDSTCGTEDPGEEGRPTLDRARSDGDVRGRGGPVSCGTGRMAAVAVGTGAEKGGSSSGSAIE